MITTASGKDRGVFSGAFFSYGFRPFFLSAGCYAPIAIVYWIGVLSGWWPARTAASPLWWHGHEMVFGWAAAALCGFLLTAVPNWTDSKPTAGAALAFLWLLWLLGRAGMWFASSLPSGVGPALDLLLIPGLLCFVLPPIYRRSEPRHYVFVFLLLVYWVANLLSLLPYTSAWPSRMTTGLYLGTYAMIVMLTIIGGRVVPNFTRNALRRRGVERDVETSETLSKLAILAVVLALAIDLVVRNQPVQSIGTVVNGCAALLAAVLLVLRARGWRFGDTWDDPLLWILHVGQGWLIVAFAARAVSGLTGLLPPTVAFHALGAGAMGTMILAFLTRAPLGHTGRPLRASRATAIAYLLVIAAGAARVLAPLLPGSSQLSGLVLAGSLFAIAYAIYVVVYFSILIRPAVR
ncbi:MAG: NnrS family protein [Deltaproteobacteria bacterium]|jgi:uncharacterized protein involved in response to NO|nr:NnrS family protein [Deltaproteobacteria bacterium]